MALLDQSVALTRLQKGAGGAARIGMALMKKGVMYSKLGDPRNEIAAYEAALEADPRQVEAAYNLGTELLEQSISSRRHTPPVAMLRRAETALRTAVALDHPDAAANLAYCLDALQQAAAYGQG